MEADKYEIVRCTHRRRLIVWQKQLTEKWIYRKANAVVHHFKYGVWCTIYFVCVPPYTISTLTHPIVLMQHHQPHHFCCQPHTTLKCPSPWKYFNCDFNPYIGFGLFFSPLLFLCLFSIIITKPSKFLRWTIFLVQTKTMTFPHMVALSYGTRTKSNNSWLSMHVLSSTEISTPW